MRSHKEESSGLEKWVTKTKYGMEYPGHFKDKVSVDAERAIRDLSL